MLNGPAVARRTFEKPPPQTASVICAWPLLPLERMPRSDLKSAARHNKLNVLVAGKENLYLPDMTAPSHLKSLQALDLALRTGSLKGAADVLAITPAAVGQRIKALEDYLGFELLTRGRSGLRPTPELANAVEPLAAAFDKLNIVGQLLDFQRINEFT
jgi:hypothetical protein